MQEGLLWYFHTYVGSGHFFFFWGGGGGYEDFMDIFLGSSKTWTIIMGHFCAF